MSIVRLIIWSTLTLLAWPLLIMRMMIPSPIRWCFIIRCIILVHMLFSLLIFIVLWIFHFSEVIIIVIFILMLVSSLSLSAAARTTLIMTSSPWRDFVAVLEFIVDPLVHQVFKANPYEVIVMAIDYKVNHCHILHSIVVSEDGQALNQTSSTRLITRTWRAFVKFVIVTRDNCILHSWSHFYSIIVAIQLQVFYGSSHFLLQIMIVNYHSIGISGLLIGRVEWHMLLKEASWVWYSTKVIKERKTLGVH